MTKQNWQSIGCPLLLAAALVLTAADAGAQQQRGGTTSRGTGSTGSRSAFGGNTGGRSSGGPTSQRDYPNNTMVGDAMISIDPETRKLIVITDDETNLQIKDIIKTLDQPKPQVLIKVVFLEVTHNDSLDLGLEGTYNRSFNNRLVPSGMVTNFGISTNNTIIPTSIVQGFATNSARASGFNNFGLAAAGANPVPPGAGLYQLATQDFTVTLRAIAQKGNAEVLSRPSILARNNQPATMLVGQSVPLVSNVRFDTFGNAINSITYTDVGVILRVTPFISSENMVEMILSPELSSVSDTQSVAISAGVTAPVINKRSADTVVVTPDGQTVIVGGLMGRQKSKSESKVPFLGDIPLIGNLFKHRITTDLKTELMIFLTPHIIPAAGQLSALNASELKKMPMTPSQLSQQELDQFLEGLPVKRLDDSGKPPKAKK